MALRIEVTIQQRQLGGDQVKVKFSGTATDVEGTKEQIAKMLLEAEMHGNDGKSRIYISAFFDK